MRSIVTLALLALTGCAASEAADERFTARDSAGIRIAESRTPQWEDSAAWRLAAQPSLSIGVVEGPVISSSFASSMPSVVRTEAS
jgi:hypothetical protein